MTKKSLILPDPQDLIGKIHFDSEEGKIWLDEQRMLLIHSAVMGLLRKELIETLGIERAKGFLTRFGYHSGMRDAEFAKKQRPDMPDEAAFMVGAQLHAIEGMVKAIPTAMNFDVEKGEFTFAWDGQTSDGEQAPEGAYRFRIYGIVAGEKSELQAMTYRKVDSVTLAGAGGNILLNLNGGSSMALADVVEVSES